MRSLRHVQPAKCLGTICALVTAFSVAGAARGAPAILTHTAQIRGLSAEEAGRELPVRLHAVVTHYDPGWGDVFVQDASGGAYVAAEGPLDLHQGEWVEVTGLSVQASSRRWCRSLTSGFWAPAGYHHLERYLMRT